MTDVVNLHDLLADVSAAVQSPAGPRMTGVVNGFRLRSRPNGPCRSAPAVLSRPIPAVPRRMSKNGERVTDDRATGHSERRATCSRSCRPAIRPSRIASRRSMSVTVWARPATVRARSSIRAVSMPLVALIRVSVCRQSRTTTAITTAGESSSVQATALSLYHTFHHSRRCRSCSCRPRPGATAFRPRAPLTTRRRRFRRDRSPRRRCGRRRPPGPEDRRGRTRPGPPATSPSSG